MDSLQLVPELSQYHCAYPDRVSLRVFVEDMPPQTRASLSSQHGEEVPASLLPSETPETHRWFSWWASPNRPSWTLSLPSDSMSVTLGRISESDVAGWLPDSHVRRLFLVCGPDGFVKAMAGPKGRDLVFQGTLGGILAKLGYQSTDVFKM